MNSRNALRAFLWSAVGLVIVLAVSLVLLNREQAPQMAAAEPYGGPFQLTNGAGETVTDASLAGHPYAVFFGFTRCPDVCPTTLAELAVLINDLGPDAQKIDFLFVSVDPERDTPAEAAAYAAAFSDRIEGLGGTVEQVRAMTDAYGIYTERVDLGDGDYTIDHTASVLLIDADGQFAGAIGFTDPRDEALAKLRRLAASA